MNTRLLWTNKWLISIIIVLANAFCAPKLAVQKTQTFPALSPQESFLVMDVQDTTQIVGATVVGDLSFRDMGLALDCGYEQILQAAEQQARQMGANCLKITEHQPPNNYHTCDRIKARAYHIADLSPYERKIIWHPTRRLAVKDFKGGIENRPFEAATFSGFRYIASHKSSTEIQLRFLTEFYCLDSYFKPQQDPVSLLAHEQLHFDISEMFARKFVQRIQAGHFTYASFEQQRQSLIDKCWSELHLYQDEYDSAVYQDPTKQEEWSLKVAAALAELGAFADKSVILARK